MPFFSVLLSLPHHHQQQLNQFSPFPLLSLLTQVVPAIYLSPTAIQCRAPAVQTPSLVFLEVSVYVQQNFPAASQGGQEIAPAWTNDQVGR